MKLLATATCAVLAACAMSSGILRMGPDTYSVSVAASPARGGTVGAKRVALTEAGQYCAASGKDILVTNTSAETTTRVGAGTFDVTFRCLAKGDPDLQRPDYTRPPTTIIEDRRQK